MAPEGYDGTWNDWRWKIPGHRSSSSSSIPQAGWMWHDWGRPSFWSNQGWRQWSSLVDTTSSDPRQYGGERAEVIPSMDDVVAVGGGLVRPRKLMGTSYRGGGMLTVIPQAGNLQWAVLLHQRQLGVYSAQGLKAEDQKAAASTLILQPREQKLPCHWKDGQLGGRLQQGSLHGQLWILHPVHLKPSCGSRESILHNLRPENSTYVADMCCDIPNLGGTVVSDCGDTRPTNGTRGFVLGVGDTRKCSFVVGNPAFLRAFATCSTRHSVVDVCTDRAEEVSCVVSDARGSLIEGDPSVWTSVTNGCLIDDGLTTGEPQACANLSLGGWVRSGITHTYDGGTMGGTKGPSQDSQSSIAPLGVQSCLRTTGNYQPRGRRSRFFRKRARSLVQRATRPSRG